ncbi:MAG TPA: response regulator [Acidimicrobiales bacterium]|nr:response regulator [Acidimicrobiales bacterium]
MQGARAATAAALPPIVVVDDDAVAASVIVRFLQRLGLRNPVHCADSVAGAVELVCDLPAPPVLVLLDIHLADGTGFDVIRALEPGALGRAAIVVLTASNELDDVDEAYALGAQSFLVKPVAFEGLGDIIRRVGLPWALLDPGEDLPG